MYLLGKHQDLNPSGPKFWGCKFNVRNFQQAVAGGGADIKCVVDRKGDGGAL